MTESCLLSSEHKSKRSSVSIFECRQALGAQILLLTCNRMERWGLSGSPEPSLGIKIGSEPLVVSEEGQRQWLGRKRMTQARGRTWHWGQRRRVWAVLTPAHQPTENKVQTPECVSISKQKVTTKGTALTSYSQTFAPQRQITRKPNYNQKFVQ